MVQAGVLYVSGLTSIILYICRELHSNDERPSYNRVWCCWMPITIVWLLPLFCMTQRKLSYISITCMLYLFCTGLSIFCCWFGELNLLLTFFRQVCCNLCACMCMCSLTPQRMMCWAPSWQWLSGGYQTLSFSLRLNEWIFIANRLLLTCVHAIYMYTCNSCFLFQDPSEVASSSELKVGHV